MTEPVDYDRIASDYDARYDRNDYTGVAHALLAFVQDSTIGARILEVGCGTGHWLRCLRNSDTAVIGVDPSAGMLTIAKAHAPDARLVRARAEALPCPPGSFDRIFCVNALHHFTDPASFFREARRVLADGGGLLTIGLDPHAGTDRWWVYEYFPTALLADRQRYLPTERIRELMEAAGFSLCKTQEVQHMAAQMTVIEAARRGFLDRTSTSQLMVIPDAEYEQGMKQIHGGDTDAGPKILRADLRVYGTSGWAA